ncbi:hypothetical protein [Mycobacterium sp. D16Q16]|nr:hypothetical protein [Mycobacterium sp. D16Q16]
MATRVSVSPSVLMMTLWVRWQLNTIIETPQALAIDAQTVNRLDG